MYACNQQLLFMGLCGTVFRNMGSFVSVAYLSIACLANASSYPRSPKWPCISLALGKTMRQRVSLGKGEID